jgi:hypothetical protein
MIEITGTPFIGFINKINIKASSGTEFEISVHSDTKLPAVIGAILVG